MVDLPGVKSGCWSQTNLRRYGGCDYATGEASGEKEKGDEIRSGAGGSRFDILDGWRRISSSRADGRSGDGADCRTGPSGNAWRRRNRGCQPGDVPSVRQGECWRRHPGGMGSRLRRLQRLPWLPWLWLPGLPRLRWVWRVLPVVGLLPLVLSKRPSIKLTYAIRYGRVRQCRPGQSMSSCSADRLCRRHGCA